MFVMLLQTTHTVLATQDIQERVQALGTPFAAQILKLLHFFAATYKHEFEFDFPPVHDPLAVAYVIQPDLLKTKRAKVDIEVHSPLTAGQTIVDLRPQSLKHVNVTVCFSVDVRSAWELIMTAIEKSSAQSLQANKVP